MKTKILMALFVSVFLTSCGSTPLLLKGEYPKVQTAETDLSKDEVWGKVIDYFSQEGIPINVIDKSSGLISSERMSFLDVTTTENKDGELNNVNAYIVALPVTAMFGNVLPLNNGRYDVTASWNVRIKEYEGKTLITINVVNLKGQYQNPPSQFSPTGSIVPVEVKSTGIFEKQLIELFK